MIYGQITDSAADDALRTIASTTIVTDGASTPNANLVLDGRKLTPGTPSDEITDGLPVVV